MPRREHDDGGGGRQRRRDPPGIVMGEKGDRITDGGDVDAATADRDRRGVGSDGSPGPSVTPRVVASCMRGLPGPPRAEGEVDIPADRGAPELRRAPLR